MADFREIPAVDTGAEKVQAKPSAIDSVGHAAAAAEEAIAAFEKAAADLAADMRAGTASNDAGNPLDKARLTALACMGRGQMVGSRAERARAAPAPAKRLRETKPWNLVRPADIGDAAIRHFPIGEPIGPQHDCMRIPDVQVAALVGDDTPREDRPTETFSRVRRHIPMPVAPGVTFDAAERDDNGHVVAVILRGDRVPPIAMPAGEAEQRLHTRLLMLERGALLDQPGIGPLPTREDHQRARHAAWRALLEEEGRTEEHHRKNRGQIERELAATLPAWAAVLGISGAR